MTAPDALVVFTPSGRRGRFEHGTTVLEAARRLGVDLDSVCGGRGICGRCQIEVSEGEHAKHGIVSAASHLTPAAEVEARYAADRGLADGRRLGCTACVAGDLVIDVPPESQLYRQVVRKEADAHPIEIDPVVRLYYVEVAGAELGVAAGDLRRVRDALAAEWELDELDADPAVLPELQRALLEGSGAITVAVHDGSTITGAWPGLHDHAYGIAFDIGSTTVAGHLCDLLTGEVLASAGEMNPQIRFGEDLMSRVSYVMLNPGSEKELTRVVRGCLAKLTAELATAAEIDRTDILEVTLVGNPIMHHLLLGIDPTPLGGAPFALTIDEAVRLPARELGLPVHRGARAYVLPCIAGHVGADSAGVILSEGPHLGERSEPHRRCRNQRRDRSRQPRPAARRLEPHRARVRGRADLVRPACRSGRDRTRPHRSRDARAAHPRDRVRRVVGRARVCGHAGHGRLWLGDHRGDRGAPSRRRAHDRRDDRRRAREPLAADRRRRAHLLLCSLGGRARAGHHAERRAADPAGQGGPLRGLRTVDGAVRDRDGRPHPARGSVRDAHRPRSRARARARSRLRPRSGHRRGQRRGHRCADRAPQPGEREPRSRTSCVASRRWRPRSSRASRSSS